jgi:O-antigen/teichoic acid export membrane protein
LTEETRTPGARGAPAQAEAESAARNLDATILRSSGWVAVSLAGKQLASLLALLVLARLLEPEAFGVVSLAWAVLAFVEQLQETGVGAALVYRREDLAVAAASALLWGAAASVALYVVIFALAPFLSTLLHSPQLTWVLRVLALVVVFRGLGAVPTALLERSFAFRARSKADVASALVQVVVSLALAAAGAGVWSLVGGAVAAGCTQLAILWFVLPWYPSPRRASRAVLREMMRYGRYVGVGNVLNVIENTIDNFAVARFVGVSALGFYSVSFRLANFPNAVLGHIVGRVTFPAYSRVRDDRDALRRLYVQNLQRISLVSLPVSVGIMVGAEPLVVALMGEQWTPSVTPLRILAVYGLVKSFASPAGSVFKGLGQPHFGPLVSALHLVLAVPLLYALTRLYGIDGAAAAVLILMVVVSAPAVGIAMRLVDLRLGELARALASQFLCAGLLAIALLVVVRQTSSLSPWLSLVVLTVVGAAVFAGASALFSRDVLVPMWVSLRSSR